MSIEKLLKLEETGKHVFHGSPDGNIDALEPRQGTHIPDLSQPTETIPDGSPAVSATPYAELAAFRALINRINIPFAHHNGFGLKDKEKEFRVSSEDVLESAKDKNGYVYVFDKNEFEPYNRNGQADENSMEWRAYKTVKPLEVVEVSSKDLPPRDKIKIANN